MISPDRDRFMLALRGIAMSAEAAGGREGNTSRPGQAARPDDPERHRPPSQGGDHDDLRAGGRGSGQSGEEERVSRFGGIIPSWNTVERSRKNGKRHGGHLEKVAA